MPADLFANSNPVMYSDPSGHSISLTEAVGVCAIIGAISGMYLYDMGFLRSDNETRSISGYLKYAVVGAIVAALVCLIVYAIVFMYYILLAYLLPGSELLRQKLSQEDIALTTSQYTRVDTVANAINDHLTFKDFTGAIRDLMGKPVVSQSGKVWQHLNEVTTNIKPLKQASSSISKMLNNPKLSSDTRELLTYTQHLCAKYIDYFNKIIERFS